MLLIATFYLLHTLNLVSICQTREKTLFTDTVTINHQLRTYNESINKSAFQALLDTIILSSTLLDYEAGLSIAYYHKGSRYSSVSKIDSALLYYHQAKRLFDNKNEGGTGRGSMFDYSLEVRRQLAYLYLWHIRDGNDSARFYLSEAPSKPW